VKSDVFYYGTYEAIINIVADDCGKKPTLFCSTGNEYNIVTISGEPIRNCTGKLFITDLLFHAAFKGVVVA
jgi:hypothetical protein